MLTCSGPLRGSACPLSAYAIRPRKVTPRRRYTVRMAVVFCEIESPRRCLAGDTHVYAADLGDAGRLEGVLTADERARAGRFRLGRIRDQFVAARGRLRLLLGHYLD